MYKEVFLVPRGLFSLIRAVCGWVATAVSIVLKPDLLVSIQSSLHLLRIVQIGSHTRVRPQSLHNAGVDFSLRASIVGLKAPTLAGEGRSHNIGSLEFNG